MELPTHELFDGKTYQFIRKLDDIDPVDLEQIYWDTSDPDILYYANRTYNNLYRYRVSTRAKEVLHNFDAQCTSETELHGGSDPLFNSWDSKNSDSHAHRTEKSSPTMYLAIHSARS